MNNEDLYKLTKYLQTKFDNKNISVKRNNSDSSMAEMYINSEFIATIYKDEEDGEVSYDINMSVIDLDLDNI